MLTSTLVLLNEAQSGGYAIGAFNVYNLEGIQAVLKAAEANRSPVMLQVHPKALTYGGEPLLALCLSAAAYTAIPIAVHLDHCTSPKVIRQAIASNVSSIMADGSQLDYDENVSFTRKMTALAHSVEVAVEAELGRISGTEDGLTVPGLLSRMTDPEQATEFVEKTNVDALAICIGNVHGFYPESPQLDFYRLADIKRLVSIPLVLHGASGLPDEMVRGSIELGVCKLNVNTELRASYVEALKNKFESMDHPDLLDLMADVINAMQSVVSKKLLLFGSSGRA